MSEELEQQVSDVSGESSSDSQGSPAEASQSDTSKVEAQNDKYVPYDRFQEIIQQKNEFSKRLEETERRYQDLEKRIGQPQEQPKEKTLINRLKEIDPEFGSWAEQQEAARKELEDLRTWRANAEKQNYINAATSVVDKLKSDLKVDPALHSMYLNQIPMGTPIKDIEAKYKAAHESVSKFIEAQKRAALSQYSSEKKKDAAVPASAKGPAPKVSTQKPKFSKDPEQATAQIVKRALDLRRSSDNNV